MIPPLVDLYKTLSEIYYEDAQGNASRILKDIGLEPRYLNLNSSSINIWFKVVDYVDHQDKIDNLITHVREEFPKMHTLMVLQTALSQHEPTVFTGQWHTTETNIDPEAIIEAEPTFLPISFFEIGIEIAKCVVCLKGTDGRCSESGTGFIISSDDGYLYLITNHHILPDQKSVEKFNILFNYQDTRSGTEALCESISLSDIFLSFYTEGPQHDWTAVGVKNDFPMKKFNSIKLIPTTIKQGDFVNIVQHPYGQPKQIALYHNIVVYSDDETVEYLTDTAKGTSGAPVFDSRWNVVALHKGSHPTPYAGKYRAMRRNAGLSVNTVLSGLAEQKVPGFDHSTINVSLSRDNSTRGS